MKHINNSDTATFSDLMLSDSKQREGEKKNHAVNKVGVCSNSGKKCCILKFQLKTSIMPKNHTKTANTLILL